MSIPERCWGLAFFPSPRWNHVPASESQSCLRDWFSLWGRPERLRVDNGSPWGSLGDLPTELALWLRGLGVAVIYNPPRQPQKNGVVERSQGTGKKWGEPGQCRSAAELQERIDRMDDWQRRRYPFREGRSRLEWWPELTHSGRRYQTGQESEQWDAKSVKDFLSEFVVPRRVDSSGMISIYNRNHYVGKSSVGNTVHVRYDPQSEEWIIADERGHQLRTRPADELGADRIQHLQVTHHRPREKAEPDVAILGKT